MIKRHLLLCIDLTEGPEWQTRALGMQLHAWLQKNRTVLPIENLMIMPTKGDTKLFWLEGDPIDPNDVKTLEEIKDRLKPVIEIALDIKIDKQRKYIDPYKNKRPLMPHNRDIH